MANIRTITDLLNPEEQVQNIVLREAGEEVGTQTTVSGTGSGRNGHSRYSGYDSGKSRKSRFIKTYNIEYV